MQINFYAHENIFLCARKFIFMGIKISRRAHRSFSTCACNWTALPKDNLGAPRNRTFASTNKQLTLMASIHEEEDRILKELSKTYPTNVDRNYRSYPNHHPTEELIVPDGLHYLDEFSYEENGCWKRVSGNEEERWKDICEQKRGLVVLTKDLNDGEVWGMRMDHGRKNGDRNAEPSSGAFHENLRRWMYGLMTMSDSGKMPEYPTNKEAQKHFEEKPWVKMNLKKELGENALADNALRAHIAASKKYLLEQLELYKDASIYLDCAIHEGRKLLGELYDDIVPSGDDEYPWVYYSEKHHFIIIDSYHPSAPRLWGESKRKECYSNMKEAVQNFFKDHPDFLKIPEKES